MALRPDETFLVDLGEDGFMIAKYDPEAKEFVVVSREEIELNTVTSYVSKGIAILTVFGIVGICIGMAGFLLTIFG